MRKTVQEANREAAKLDQLAHEWGMTVMEFIDRYTFEAQVPGICVCPGCDYMAEVEPDTRHGRCQQCGFESVQSGLVLAGIL
jgi:hypothetical protein